MSGLFDQLDFPRVPGLILLYLDRQWRIQFINPFGVQLLGYGDAAQLVGRPLRELVPPGERREWLDSQQGSRFPQRFDLDLLRVDGLPTQISWQVDDRGDHRPLVSPILLIGLDMQSVRQGQETARLFETVAANYPGSILITDENRMILYANPATTTMTGYEIEELIGQSLDLLYASRQPDEVHAQIRATIQQRGIWKGSIAYRRKNGELYQDTKSVAAIRDSAGNVQHFFSIGEDISRREHYEHQIDQLLLFDQLTGLPNRSAFVGALEDALSASRRHSRELAVMHVDFDYFKNVNTIIGHGGADHVLLEAVSRIRAIVRGGDVLARAASDEFLILLDPVTAPSEIGDVATRILMALREPYQYFGDTIDLTASIGVASHPGGGDSAQQLLANAMSATKRAKAEGGNDWRQFESNMAKADGWRRDLRQAIERNEMRLYFQPQVSLFSGGIIGLEALLRWEHPQRGMVSPKEFIPVAEESNFIVGLGEWVVQEVCRQMRAWRDAGLPPIKVGVNLAARHFRKASLPMCIANASGMWDVDPRFIEIEITESAMMQDISATIRNMSQLKEMGVRISLDDFGTGYSSMAYLSRFPIDVVKIDQSFVRDITTNPVNAAIAQATIAMSHKLGKIVLAEGVETAEQMQYLRRSGCDEMQGYYFARPMPVDEVTQLLRQDVRLNVSGESTESSETILIVDDEVSILNSLKRILRREGYNILAADSTDEAFALLAKNPVHVIISDQHMPGLVGTEFLSQVKSMYPETVRMVLSAYSEISTVTDAINKGAAYRFLTKPWNDEQIKEEIRGAMRHWREQYGRAR